jgi:glycosyltransferase involved in cell wall biosynthesis
MNKGIERSSGDIIGFLNADDFYLNKDVLTQVADVFSDENIDACYADLCYVAREDSSRTVRYWRSETFEPGAFARGWCPPHPTFFVRRAILQQAGGFSLNYRIASDVDLMMRLLEVERVKSVYVAETWVKMRLGGVTNRSASNIIQQNREIIRSLQGFGLYRGAALFWIGKVASRSLQYLRRSNAKGR